MQFLTPTTIGIAAICGFLFGNLWFSRFLFMKALLIGEGETIKDVPKRSKVYIMQINFYALIAHGVMATVLALIFEILQVNSLKLAISLGALFAFGFIVTRNYMEMVYTVVGSHWNKKSQVKFLVNSGYYIFVMIIMSGVIFLMS